MVKVAVNWSTFSSTPRVPYTPMPVPLNLGQNGKTNSTITRARFPYLYVAVARAVLVFCVVAPNSFSAHAFAHAPVGPPYTILSSTSSTISSLPHSRAQSVPNRTPPFPHSCSPHRCKPSNRRRTAVQHCSSRPPLRADAPERRRETRSRVFGMRFGDTLGRGWRWG